MRWTCSTAVRELAERRRDLHLALFLERPHAVAPGLRGAADEDHGPEILLRIGEAGEGVHDAGARHDEAGAGTPGQIANGLRGIRGGLLVAHPDIGDSFLLRGGGDRAHRKPDDPEHVWTPCRLRFRATKVAPSTSLMSSLLSEWDRRLHDIALDLVLDTVGVGRCRRRGRLRQEGPRLRGGPAGTLAVLTRARGLPAPSRQRLLLPLVPS